MHPQSNQTRSGWGQDGVRAERDGGMFCLRFRKGTQRWLFRFPPGGEYDAIEAVRSIMREGRGLDWLDVAVITHEIRRVASYKIAC